MTSRDESETGKMSSRDELEALLPFYLNGTLDEVDLASVEEWLATDPEALAALEAAELEFSGTTAANEAIKPPADALDADRKSEPNYHVLGAKSFGRRRGFRMVDGLGQIRRLFQVLGDRETLDLYASVKLPK